MIKLIELLKESINEGNTVLGKSGNYAVTQYGEPGGVILTKNRKRVAIGNYDSDAQIFWFTDLPNENSDKGFDEVKDILKYATKKKLTFVGESVNEGKVNMGRLKKDISKLTDMLQDEMMFGNPDVKAIVKLLKADKLSDAAYEFLSSFADQDGGEGKVNWESWQEDVEDTFAEYVK
jgi:hypothetical protein